jgi:alpha-galactosidase
VAALINWADESRELTLNLPDIGVQFAGQIKNIWAGKSVRNVKTSYTSTVQPHGVMLLELEDTISAGSYSGKVFAKTSG